MANITLSQFTQEDLTEGYNQAVDYFLARMVDEKILTQEQVDTCSHYRIVVGDCSMWGKFWKFFRPTGDSRLEMFVVKHLAKEKKHD